MTLLTLLKATSGGGGMPIGYRSSDTSGTADSQSTSKTCPVPSGAAAGDIALLCLEQWQSSGTDPTVAWPSGFTEIVNTLYTNSGNMRLKVAWKRLTGADSGSYTMTWGTTQWNMAHCILITGGLASGNPVDATHTANANSSTIPTTTVTTTVAGDMLVTFSTVENSATQTTVPTSFTEVQDHIYLHTSYRIAGTAGSYSAASGVLSASTPTTAALVAIKPDAGGGTDYTQTPSDNEGLTDSAAFAIGAAAADTEPLTDAAAFAQGKATTESLGLTDSASVSFVLDRASSDSLGITDSISLATGLGVSAADNLGLTDSTTLARSQAPSDGLGLTDAATLTRGVGQASTDNLGLTDATTVIIGQSQADLVGLTDSVSIQASGAGSVTPSDTEGLTDSTALSRSQATADSEGLTDSILVEPVRLRSAADNLGLSDQVTLVVTRDLGDTITLSDAAALTASFVRVLSETTDLTDTAQVALTGPTTGTVIRPNIGTTPRIGSGITPRPFTGTTVRPG